MGELLVLCYNCANSLFICSGTQVKEHKVKKVKEMNINPFVRTENALLAERSFVSGQHKPSVGNGYCLEWTEKMANNNSPPHDGHTKVGICLTWQIFV